MGGTLSLGIDCAGRLNCNNCDNCVYVIEGWKIVDRLYFEGQEQDYYKLMDMLQSIDAKMPEEERLGSSFFNSEEVPIEDIEIGDEVLRATHERNLSYVKLSALEKMARYVTAQRLTAYLILIGILEGRTTSTIILQGVIALLENMSQQPFAVYVNDLVYSQLISIRL